MCFIYCPLRWTLLTTYACNYLDKGFQLDIAFARTGLSTSNETRLLHVILGERGRLFGQANDNAVEASLVLALHPADQAEEDRYLKRDR